MKIIKPFISAISLFLTTLAFAQAPSKMSYQAVIRNTSNNLITNQVVGMQISILQGSASGTAVYVETQNPSSNANGLVSLQIGSGTLVSGSMATIDWANGPYFIKTETDPTGGSTYTITGTSQLLSVPYALYAKTSGSSTPGPTGPTGLQGIQGIAGTNGQGVPTGGTTGQVLAKIDATNYNTQWTTLLPTQTGNTGKVLTTNGTSTSWGNYVPPITTLANFPTSHQLLTSAASAFFMSPFTTFVTTNTQGNNVFFIPAAGQFTINIYSYDDDAVTYELWPITAVASSTLYTPGTSALVSGNAAAWSSGPPVITTISYTSTANQLYSIKVKTQSGANFTTASCHYTTFSAQ